MSWKIDVCICLLRFNETFVTCSSNCWVGCLMFDASLYISQKELYKMYMTDNQFLSSNQNWFSINVITLSIYRVSQKNSRFVRRVYVSVPISKKDLIFCQYSKLTYTNVKIFLKWVIITWLGNHVVQADNRKWLPPKEKKDVGWWD